MKRKKIPEWIQKAAQRVDDAGEPQEGDYCTADHAADIITDEFNKAAGDITKKIIEAIKAKEWSIGTQGWCGIEPAELSVADDAEVASVIKQALTGKKLTHPTKGRL